MFYASSSLETSVEAVLHYTETDPKIPNLHIYGDDSRTACVAYGKMWSGCAHFRTLNVDVDPEIKDATALWIRPDQDRASWVSYGYQYGFNASFQMFTLTIGFYTLKHMHIHIPHYRPTLSP